MGKLKGLAHFLSFIFDPGVRGRGARIFGEEWHCCSRPSVITLGPGDHGQARHQGARGAQAQVRRALHLQRKLDVVMWVFSGVSSIRAFASAVVSTILQ